MGKTAKRVAMGTVIAAAAGYVAGILTAPKSGRETRENIKTKAAQTKTQAEKQLKQLHTELGKVLDQAREQAETARGKAKVEIDAAMDKTRVVKEKARELLSALHEGDADDKDLRKAIDEANKTIAHLRAYLKKS
ncbi:MAG TPA: YtxH domain-containing protein [Candidatus Saccharimonadales bacterium]|jgi:gas vesicle protein|nr:YtxH domain-containing protein [Candidatus Saccharimonadales bacterium]